MTQNDLKGFRFRESTRAPFETEVKLRFDRFGGAVSGFSADISMEGMFVRTSEPKPVGTLVQFEFGLGTEGELIQGLGDVVWVRTRQLAPNKPPGMGIQFRYIDPHSRELIFKIVDKYLKETKQEGVPAGVEATPVTPEEAGSAAATDSQPPASAPATAAPPAAAPAPPAPSVSQPPPAGQPGQVVPAPSEAPIPPPSSPTSPTSPTAPSAVSAGGVTTGPPPAATSEPSPPASARPATPAGAPGGAAGPSAASVGDEEFSFAIPSLESEEGESISSPPPSPASPPRSTSGRGELFVPDEVWDPVSAAAQAVAAEPLAGPPSRPSYAGGAGVARQSSGSRRWLVVALLVLVVAAAAFLFRDRLLDLLPGAQQPVQEATAAPDLDQEAEASGADALPLAEETVPTEASEGPGEEEQLGDGDTSAGTSAAAQLAPNAPTEPQEVQQAVGAAPIRVEEIRSWQRAGETLVTIEGDGTFRERDYTELRLERPPRLLVKLFGIEEEYLALTPVGSPELRQIRTALHGGNELHVVLDLATGDVRSTVTLEEGRLRIRLER